MRYHDLIRRWNDKPFKPFRIRMSNASAIDVLSPGSVIVGRSSAVVPTATKTDARGYQFAEDWKTISIAHIVEFIDLNEKSNGKRKRP
jgi:hypothetical protein